MEYHFAHEPPAANMNPEGEMDEDEEEEPSSFINPEWIHKGPARSDRNDDDEERGNINEEGEANHDDDSALPMLGGRIDAKAFCLLDGIFEKDGNRRRVTIPLTRLPAILGRSHSTGDVNFFALGPAKVLSRQHCVIDYRDGQGGKLVTPKSAARDTDEEGKLEYEPANESTPANADGKPEDDKENAVPARGAFVLEALGKNLIMVGSQRLRQGEIAVLESGTPIRMSTYSLYFLLPTDTSNPPTTLEIPLPNHNDPGVSSSPSNKKPATAGAAGVKRKMPSPPQDSLVRPPAAKKPKAAPFANLQAELDGLPIETLLERMDDAVESERWERRHQLIGSTISYHAVRDATSAPEIREQAVDGGVARTEIMRWIRESPKYCTWVEQMMSKMEAKSYQNTITKALLKAGNVRTGSGGRYIKWILPGVTLMPPGESGGDAPPEVPPSGDEPNNDDEEGDENEDEGEGGNEEEDDDDDDAEGEDEGKENDEDDERVEPEFMSANRALFGGGLQGASQPYHADEESMDDDSDD